MKNEILILILCVISISCSSDDKQEMSNQAPELLDSSITINEHTPNGTEVALFLAQDTDSESLTFSLVSQSVNGAFQMNASGILYVLNDELLDYETSNSITLNVEVSDGELSDTAIITVNLNNIDVPSEGLQIYYPFAGNHHDESNYGFDLTSVDIYGGEPILTVDREGINNNAYSFDSGMFLNDSGYNTGTTFTMSTWFKTDDIGVTNQTILYLNEKNTFNSTYNLRLLGNYIRYAFYNSAGSYTEIDTPILVVQSNQWHHLIIRQESNSVSFHLDGNLVHNESISLPTANISSEIKMGATGTGGAGARRFFGDLDDISLYNRALSNYEIEQLAADTY